MHLAFNELKFAIQTISVLKPKTITVMPELMRLPVTAIRGMVSCHSNTWDGFLSQQYVGWLPVTAIRGIVACHNNARDGCLSQQYEVLKQRRSIVACHNNMLQILYCQAHFSVQETY